LDQQLVNLIGDADGAQKSFDLWRQEAQQAGLNPSGIQNLKRRGLVWTFIAENGQHMIVRGAKPA